MNISYDLHPLASDVLEAFAGQLYFRSIRLTNALAERNATQCVRWAFSLVERFVNASTPCEVVAHTLSSIRDAMASQSADALVQLDDLSWQSWCAGAFDETSPFAQRAVARLGWATMLLIADATSTSFESQYTGLSISAGTSGAIREMANQCGMAVDMIYTDTNDGRLMVAASFSREMITPS